MQRTALALSIALVTLAATTAEARPRPGASRPFSANKTFGLGIMIGAPTGLSGKYYLSANTAFDFGVGTYNRHYGRRDGLHVHGDFLWHPLTLVSTPPFELPLYFGLGARLWDHGAYRNDYVDDTHIGLRVPIGIIFDFNRIPIDIFLEFALVVDLIVDNDNHGYSDFNGAVGFRYYF